MLYHLQNNSWFISKLLPFRLSSPSPFPSILAVTSHITLSIYTLNTHGDITQPCLNTTLTGNHTLTFIPTRPHTLLCTKKSSELRSTIFLYQNYRKNNSRKTVNLIYALGKSVSTGLYQEKNISRLSNSVRLQIILYF